jgi:hypothetical protein
VEPAVAEHPAAAVDELARREVAEPRCRVVELHLGHAVAGVMDQHHADGLVTVLHQERGPAGSGTGAREAREEAADVLVVHRQHVPQVRVGDADLEHLVGSLVVPLTEQQDDEPHVDPGEHGVHRDHRPDAQQRVERDQHQARDQVQHAEPQHTGLQQRVDEQCGARPSQCVQPRHGLSPPGCSAAARRTSARSADARWRSTVTRATGRCGCPRASRRGCTTGPRRSRRRGGAPRSSRPGP